MSASTHPPIYLDHNATTPVFPEVIEAMQASWSKPHLNPASQHEFGRRARRIVENARDRLAELLGAGPQDHVLFTSGGTESNNLALRGLLHTGHGRLSDQTGRAHLVVSPIEHPSVASLADGLIREGWDVGRLSVDRQGVIQRGGLPQLLTPNTRVVAAMLANNETGVLQPVAELAAMCNERGVPLHTDAAQVAGKCPLNFRELGAATMTIAAHKFGGPVGIGALVVRRDTTLAPLLRGGVQQGGIRPGTESVALTVGLQKALELWERNRGDWDAHLRSLQNNFESAIQRAIPSAEVIGGTVDRLHTTSNVAFVDWDRQALFVALDQGGVACSTGSACASGSSEPSPTLIAMGLEQAVVSSALRFSFGVSTTHADLAEAIDRITRTCNNLRRRKVG